MTSPGVRNQEDLIFPDQDEEAIREQAINLVTSAFGKKYAQLLTEGKAAELTSVYCVPEDSQFREIHEQLSSNVSVSYRIPGSHPDLDLWESVGNMGDIRKVESDEDCTWYVADFSCESNAYIMISQEIATRSLRKAAEVPEPDDDVVDLRSP